MRKICRMEVPNLSKPIVAVVGRPNVGKSTLFNKLVGQRISIVEDTPGVTRDRIYADVEWTGKQFTLIDTGGIEPDSHDTILAQMRRQAEIAIETADVIMFIVDLKAGVTADDIAVAAMLRKTKKPVLLVVNKVERFDPIPTDIYEFYNLGMGDPIAISAINGLGLGDLLDEVYNLFPEEKLEAEEEEEIKVAIIGKPNAGKSSLVNKIVGENRVIVSDIAGTTRDAIDTPFIRDDQKFVLIDTAGIRKKSRVYENIEKYSVLRSQSAVERADVCVIMIDAEEGVTEQDTKVAGLAHEAGKSCIIVVNKWDLIAKDNKTYNNFKKDVQEKFAYMSYAPIEFISAKTGQRVEKLLDLIQFVAEQHAKRVSTGMLNDVLNEAMAMNQPPSDKGRRLKIFYITQASVKPPTFVLFINDKELMHFSYLRYIENQIRTAFDFQGTPIQFVLRERGKE